jgi:flagellar export protein FliJ
MAFRFTLATVLRVRENIEHTEALRLEKCYADLAKVQGMLWEAEQNIARATQAKQEELARGVIAVELQSAMEEESRWKQRSAELLQQLREAQTRLREQIAAYSKARRSRDVLEELRIQQFAVYRREQDKSEQRERDETFLLRRKSRH